MSVCVGRWGESRTSCAKKGQYNDGKAYDRLHSLCTFALVGKCVVEDVYELLLGPMRVVCGQVVVWGWGGRCDG